MNRRQIYFSLIFFILLHRLFFHNHLALAQSQSNPFDEDLDVGGDIFQDFNEDLEVSEVVEDERFYRYARFFGVNIGAGFLNYTDNRGLAFKEMPPALSFSLQYFGDFHSAILIGIQTTRHVMVLDSTVQSSDSKPIGAVISSSVVPFVSYRFYLDTSDLGTALTYSSPYGVLRVEYWYQVYEFPDNDEFGKEDGGGMGFVLGGGFEFPIEIKKSYINVEFLYHRVGFRDEFTSDYRQIEDDPNSTKGFNDLRGDVISMWVHYHFSY